MHHLLGSESGSQLNSAIASGWNADSGADPDSDSAVSANLSGSQPKVSGLVGVMLTPDLVIAEKGV